MSALTDFYADQHLDRADGFGSMTGRSYPHRGFDVNKHPLGTPVPTWSEGVVDRAYWSNVLGNTVVVRASNGWVGFCHLQQAIVQPGQQINAGDVIGLLGSTGSASTGPHVHTTFSTVGGDPATSPVQDPLPLIIAARDGTNQAPKTLGIPETREDGIPGVITWKRLQTWLSGFGYNGPIDGSPGKYTFAALQRALKPYGYDGPDDGDPGPNTWKAMQRLAQHYGYTGLHDGKPGLQTWAAMQRFANTIPA